MFWKMKLDKIRLVACSGALGGIQNSDPSLNSPAFMPNLEAQFPKKNNISEFFIQNDFYI